MANWAGTASKAWTGFVDTMCNQYAGNNGKMLLHLGALGWVLSSAAHIFMIAKSDTIDKEKKKFLLPQEMLDGVVNVGLYYTLTDIAKRGADWMVENRRMPKSTIDVAKKFFNTNEDGLVNAFKQVAQENQAVKKGILPAFIKKPFAALGERGASSFYKKAIDGMIQDSGLSKGEIFTAISKAKEAAEPITQNTGILKKMTSFFKLNNQSTDTFKKAMDSIRATGVINNKKVPEQLLDALEAQANFRTFKNGVGTLASIVASVLVVSIITPIVRNKITGKIIKKQEAPEDKKVFYNSGKGLPLVFKSFSGNMKI